MANDRDKAIRDYVVLASQVIHPGIVRPEVEAVTFELKLVMFQMLQTIRCIETKTISLLLKRSSKSTVELSTTRLHYNMK